MKQTFTISNAKLAIKNEKVTVVRATVVDDLTGNEYSATGRAMKREGDVETEETSRQAFYLAKDRAVLKCLKQLKADRKEFMTQMQRMCLEAISDYDAAYVYVEDAKARVDKSKQKLM